MESPSASVIEAFVATPFDYIVIGGGTAGLVVANRLSEDPNVKVAILEAGFLHENDPIIDIPRNLAMNNGQPKYDWVSSTAPQTGAAGRSIPIFRGKLVGGSSALNYLGWDRGSKEEYDAWRLVSDSKGGWSWDTVLPFLKKPENAAPDSVSRDLAVEYSASQSHVSSPGIPREVAVGVGGPIKLNYNMVYSDAVPRFVKAWNALGIHTNANPFGGDACGIYNTCRSVDYESGKRITSTAAYYTPAASRPNLKLLTGAHVTKILFKLELLDGNHVAAGVEFSVDEKLYSVPVAKEVVLSAGTMQTPQILELSGIGDSQLLQSMGIKTLVDLPGVGENLNDHLFTFIQFQAKRGTHTFDEFRNNPQFAAAEKERYEKTGQGWMASNDTTTVFTPLNKIMEESVLSAKLKEIESTIPPEKSLFVEQFSIQLDWLKKANVPHVEFVLFSQSLLPPEPDECYFGMNGGLQHPLSRGTVHIQSSDPHQQPLIDPRYLTHEFDVFSLLAAFRTMEKVAQTSPLADIVGKQIMPPSKTMSDEEAIGYIRSACISGGHSMGTAAMARRELKGVVNSNLKVHGTANLRVADASIIPMPLAAHLQATVYAIGEKAADFIKMGA